MYFTILCLCLRKKTMKTRRPLSETDSVSDRFVQRINPKDSRPFRADQRECPCRDGRDRTLGNATPFRRPPGADRQYRNAFRFAESRYGGVRQERSACPVHPFRQGEDDRIEAVLETMLWTCASCPIGKESKAKFVRLFGRRTPGYAPVVLGDPRLHHPHRIREPYRTLEIQGVARPEQVGGCETD